MLRGESLTVRRVTTPARKRVDRCCNTPDPSAVQADINVHCPISGVHCTLILAFIISLYR